MQVWSNRSLVALMATSASIAVATSFVWSSLAAFLNKSAPLPICVLRFLRCMQCVQRKLATAASAQPHAWNCPLRMCERQISGLEAPT